MNARQGLLQCYPFGGRRDWLRSPSLSPQFVKRYGQYKSPFFVDTDQNGMSPWIMRQKDLARNLPELFQQFRRSGNRNINPFINFNSWNAMPQDFDDHLDAMEFLMQSVSRRGNGLSPSYYSGAPWPMLENLWQNYELTRQAQMNGNIVELEDRLVNTLAVLQQITSILDSNIFGYEPVGQLMFEDLLALAQAYIPLFDGYPDGTYDLLEFMFRMTKEDTQMMAKLVDAMTFTQKQDIFTYANASLLRGGWGERKMARIIKVLI